MNTFPKGHKLGNKLFNTAIRICFGKGISDVLSDIEYYQESIFNLFQIY